ncbi:hypothetical protein AOG27_20940, partial [Pseudoalteromonas lipolytica]
LVGLHGALPLLAALAVVELGVDPRQQAACQRRTEVVGGEVARTHRRGDLAVDIEDGAGRIGQFVGHAVTQATHLVEKLAHVLGAGAGGRLIGHGGHPLDQVRLEQSAQAHQHQADGAVAADKGPGATGQLGIDHMAVDRVEHDGGVVFHAQGAGGIDPVALPACLAQVGVDLLGIVAALAGDDHVERL